MLADLVSVEQRARQAAPRRPRATRRSLPEIAALERAEARARRGDAGLPVGADRRRAGAARSRLPADEQARARRRQRRRRPARRGRRARRARSATTRSPSASRSRVIPTSCRRRPAERAQLLADLGVHGERRAAARPLGVAPPRPQRRSSRPATRSRARGRSAPAPTAPECAGVIHSDLQRGFIRAEVIDWSELLEIGSWAKAKELGQAAGRGQGLRRGRRRRPRDPVQRVSRHGRRTCRWLVRRRRRRVGPVEVAAGRRARPEAFSGATASTA